MNVFNYVAESNPIGSVQLINSFGYDVTNDSNLGKSLSELVAEVGEEAFKKVIDLHPDKDVILELNSDKNLSNKNSSCSCDVCKSISKKDEYLSYLNVTGKGQFADEKTIIKDNSTNTHLLANQTNVILVISALFIATALILKK